MGKLLDFLTGQDITPAPPTEEDIVKEQFTLDLIELLTNSPINVAVDTLFENYLIKKHG